MNDLKIFTKSEREVYGLASTVQILNKYRDGPWDKEVWCTCIGKRESSVISRSIDV